MEIRSHQQEVGDSLDFIFLNLQACKEKSKLQDSEIKGSCDFDHDLLVEAPHSESPPCQWPEALR